MAVLRLLRLTENRIRGRDVPGCYGGGSIWQFLGGEGLGEQNGEGDSEGC